MRFFTLKWWCGTEVGAGRETGPAYAAHLATIRDRLPPNLSATEEAVLLHDTRLRDLQLDVAAGTLDLGLESYAGDERFALHYRGVERFGSTAEPAVGLLGPFGYGGLGYAEVDILAGGAFEHRLLFSSGIELVVVARAFELRRPNDA